MADFETLINDAVAAQEIPGCVLVASNRDGSFNYAKAFGSTSMNPEIAKPLAPNNLMWVASCTKLMTSICAMQIVERGLTTLDAPVYTHIPELESFNVLHGFADDGSPIEKKHTKPITLRLLLSHSSGLAYDTMHPTTLAWLKFHGRAPASSGKLLERFNAPLVFEPGTSWAYGPGIDYAGLLIERLTGQKLDDYMRANLWEPLGIKDMTFFLSARADLRARMADMTLRDETGKLYSAGAAPMVYQDGEGKEVTDCMGGQSAFTSAEEYLKVLHAVLVCDEDEKILKRASLEEFFKPQLGEGSSVALNAMLQDDMVNNAMGGTPKSIKKDWGLGGLLITKDAPDGKKAGTMLWGGLPNLIWWVDRKTGLCGLYAGQVLPTGDAKIAALDRKFEGAMYAQLAQKQGQTP
ncbi:beta-lactamase/transpeptidase-like protein [Pyrenochaeta sp. DS3sAY3a]|nr:beta-lactamase/transpeptidase-like protein [Pyrenochaeta sp. DS3sAY3a]